MTPMELKISTAEQRVKTTTNLALGWMQFAYKVATGVFAPDALLNDVMQSDSSLPSVKDIADNNCASVNTARVWTIFTQRDPTWRKLRRTLTPDIALGSMLHVIQDSFSPGHTRRIKKADNKITYSIIVDVENYETQKSSSQRGLDGYPEWLAPRIQNDTKIANDPRLYANDPVEVGSWLMDAVDRRRDWKDVEKHLRETIFRSEPRDGVTNCIGGRAKRNEKANYRYFVTHAGRGVIHCLR